MLKGVFTSDALDAREHVGLRFISSAR